jgi:hypothetical protein
MPKEATKPRGTPSAQATTLRADANWQSAAKKRLDRKRPEFSETIVIYHSPDEGGWVAHGLRTDQVGIAASPVDALAQFIRLLRQLLKEAAVDLSISIHREAPYDVQEMAGRSRMLPEEIVEVAHWKALGRWPEDWQLQLPKTDETFVAEVEEHFPVQAT